MCEFVCLCVCMKICVQTNTNPLVCALIHVCVCVCVCVCVAYETCMALISAPTHPAASPHTTPNSVVGLCPHRWVYSSVCLYGLRKTNKPPVKMFGAALSPSPPP